MRFGWLLVLLTLPCAAEDDISDVLVPICKKHDLPAMGGAIVRGNALVAIGVTGVRKRGADAKVTVDDRWHLGSCTKSMTATLIGRYVERGKMRWDEPLKTQLLKETPKMHRDFRPVTTAQLLRHRAGVPSDLSFDGLWGRLWKRQGSPTAQRRLLATQVLQRAPLSKPGDKYLYANAGFAIAGHALEVRAGKSWESLMRTELFEPLGMKSAGFGAPGKGLDQPWGHGATGPVAPGPNADNPAAIGPAGTVHASLRDWSKYIALHLQGARDGEQELLLKRATLRRIQTPEKGENYAFGWIATRRPWGGGNVLTHSGSNTMWYCTAWLAPKRDFAVLVTCNQGGSAAAKACDEAAGALIRKATRN